MPQEREEKPEPRLTHEQEAALREVVEHCHRVMTRVKAKRQQGDGGPEDAA